ncbi:MAG: hypothetical protein KHW96_06595 [Firmicutes bacterium]|nr:hypothetical protein [Bacillota bacterium]MBU5431324.1 hypothetical protein [Intestinimonas sp. MSJ-38]
MRRICKVLDANIGDIMEFLSEKSQDDLSGNDYMRNIN